MEKIFDKVSLQTTSIRDITYELLRKAIIDGKLKPGERLVEAQLSEQLCISRTPLREALLKLEIEGLVERLPNGGLAVSPISIREVRENSSVRCVIEGLIAREAAQKCTDNDKEKLLDIIRQLESTVLMGKYSKALEHCQDIHSFLAKIADNQRCISILKSIDTSVKRYGHYIMDLKDRGIESYREHLEVCKWVVENNPEKAEEAMKKHIIEVGNRMLEKIHKMDVFSEESTEES